MLKTVNPFLVIAISIFILLVVPISIQDGMFMDGSIYASVAKNMANGNGSFWFPTFSQTEMVHYHEQLPLFCGLEALFFKALGNSIYTEFIFLLILALLSTIYLIKIWRISVYKQTLQSFAWLPIILWVITPVVFWSYANNVQETLMVLFALSSVFHMFIALKKQHKILLNLTLSGVLIFLCSFCKGFQGLFPLVGIILFWFCFKTISLKKAIIYSLYIFSIIAITYSLLLFNETSFKNIESFFNDRIVATFANDYSAHTPFRFYLFWMLFQELIPAFIAVFIIIIIFKIKKQSKINSYNKTSLFFFLLALSGSLPLIVTTEQRGFYLCTSIPFYILSLSFFVLPYLTPLFNKKKEYISLKKYSLIILITSLIIPLFFIGKTCRDQNQLHDINIIGNYIGEGEILGAQKSIIEEYSILAYFSRHYSISLDINNKKGDYFISYKKANNVPSGYKLINKNLIYFNLYKK